jgi:nitroimidazol reductase NimA-like FMN-containing flavoprotein (pyridoxamine 5'-phosphate oxidase superfamily)
MAAAATDVQHGTMPKDRSAGTSRSDGYGFVALPKCDEGTSELTAAELDRNGLEVLARAECLRLLGTTMLGRIGMTVDGDPMVLPVNFCVVEGDIVCRTGDGTKLATAARNAVVAFEVDEFDPLSHAGWSVVVTGASREVTDPSEAASLRAAHLPRWASDGEDHLIAVGIRTVTGRRITSCVRARERRATPPAR